MSAVREPIEVWTDAAGLPARLVWRARRYRVTDRPTTLVGPAEWWQPLGDHEVWPGRAPLAISGWRFQASAENGETHVFDISLTDDRWRLLRVFD